ncbi:signal recognition particle-docking protein FtsY [Roseomonas frigidaquae]|uniref:Signal recognition particle receptor FtsY n=2 Tax=Falsiroseomonas frigidaquae TaxID=487318 RepID=A0ABX1F7F9_9PROT|nr:signal recognition particle-docking protein FtsY [Falsiroseomonas frigidaquae]NKE48255.1 signal recognition particle-docking protein FtsY [Falsiroseomonas frigidaquae]
MALKGFWDRLRGREPAPQPSPEPSPEPAQVTPPPAQPPIPVAPGPETPQPPMLPPVSPLPPVPATPAPFTTLSPQPQPEPAPEALPMPGPEQLLAPADDDAALNEALASSEPEPATPAAGGWFSRLKTGLSRSTARLTDALTTVFRKRRLDDAALEELEDTLIAADLGVAAARRIVEGFRKTRFGREVSDEEVKAALAEAIAEILAPVAKPLEIRRDLAPHVVLVVGVNGTGKTTTIAKLGQQYRAQGLKVMFAAGDTFRAAAVEQLQIWGDRTGCPVVAPAKMGADAAGLAHDALSRARAEGMDLLLIDTAGRLHNKSALMEELAKIIRVIRKLDPSAPHSVLLTLDATTGQNALQQVRTFKDMVAVSGLAVTKLDGSAKGGVVVALAQEIGLPVHFVGVGEKAADLRPFTAVDYARGLVGLG